jgi:asparagine synthase (glutamine-hydrolysing)
MQLGHRRLSMVDLSDAASQPFEKDGLILAFNGEIYNHADLRRELRASGAAFRTTSDTEVLLEAWRRWGPGCLPRLRGMFAFAVADARRGELFLARDPFGMKPLFIALEPGGGLAFASELKALRILLPRLREIDDAALVASLLYQWVPESRCILKGAEKLPPGCWLRIAPGQPAEMRRYWSSAELLSTGRPAPTADEIADVLEESVRLHLIADAPIGCLLSGGLDSSLITALAARRPGGVDAFTIAFRAEDRRFEAMPDDLRYARLLAERTPGVRLQTISLAPDVAALLPAMVESLDEPLGDPAALNVKLICDAARERGVKALLTGMGADEIFAGYRRHQAMRAGAVYRRLPAALRGLAKRAANALPAAGADRGYRLIRWGQRFLEFADLPEEEAYRRSYSYYSPQELDALTRRARTAAIDGLLDEHRALFAAGPPGDAVNRLCFVDLHMFLPGLNLAYSDRAGMAASTELRAPFVDLEVARVAFALPGAAKIVGGQAKLALKRAAERWLPREIIYRPKAAFGAPLRAWMRRDLAGMVDDLLPRGRLVGDGWLDGPAVQRMIDEDRAGRRDHALRLWHLISLEIWLRGAARAPEGHGA